MVHRQTLVLLLLASGFALPCLAQVDIHSRTDKSRITVGDRLEYVIEITYPREGEIELPSVLGNLAQFEVKEYEAGEPVSAKDKLVRTWRFELSTFTLGDYVIPPQLVLYRSGMDTTQVRTFMTQPIEIEVVRTSPEDVWDIADIAGPVPIPKARPWALYLLICLPALALAAVALWWYRRKHRREDTPQPVLPPFEEAMEALSMLEKGGMPQDGEARGFAFRLSAIGRRYITRRFHVDALESTTEEFLSKLPSLPITPAQRESLESLAGNLDIVKFATGRMSPEEARHALERQREFVAQTRPGPEPAEASSPAQAGGTG